MRRHLLVITPTRSKLVGRYHIQRVDWELMRIKKAIVGDKTKKE